MTVVRTEEQSGSRLFSRSAIDQRCFRSRAEGICHISELRTSRALHDVLRLNQSFERGPRMAEWYI